MFTEMSLMGPEFVNGRLVKFVLYVLAFGVLAVNGLLVYDRTKD